MTEQKIEREFIVPLRRAWLRAPNYKRTYKAIKAIKQFVAKHMKVPERDVSKVKLDVYFNNDLWFRGRKHPPSKVKIKARKEEEIVYVTFAEEPQYVKFIKAKQSKIHKPAEEKPAPKSEEKQEEKPKEEVAVEQEKKVEEKEKEAELQAKAQKHVTKVKEPKIQRMALKK
jgi:ribosomal protein L31E